MITTIFWKIKDYQIHNILKQQRDVIKKKLYIKRTDYLE